MISESAATFRIGHWTDAIARTGCTTILFDRLVPTVVDVRGGAPGTRETDLLDADRMVGAVDAVLLTGGSAHGLSAAEGVMQFLRETDRGVQTAAGRVPLCPQRFCMILASAPPGGRSPITRTKLARPQRHSSQHGGAALGREPAPRTGRRGPASNR